MSTRKKNQGRKTYRTMTAAEANTIATVMAVTAIQVADEFKVEADDVAKCIPAVMVRIQGKGKRVSHSDVRGDVAFLLREEKRRARVGRVTNAALVAMTRVGLLKQTGEHTDREEVVYESAA